MISLCYMWLKAYIHAWVSENTHEDTPTHRDKQIQSDINPDTHFFNLSSQPIFFGFIRVKCLWNLALAVGSLPPLLPQWTAMHRGPPGSALTLSRPKAHQIVEYVAARQTWADNISKEILQYRVVNANCLNVYSNQKQHTQAFGRVVERNAGIVVHGTVRSDGFDSSSSRHEVIRANWVCCWENGLIV